MGTGFIGTGYYEWYKKYGRSKCKYRNKCVHCCPVCCSILKPIYDKDNRIIGFKFLGFRFEPKGDRSEGGGET